MVADGGTLAIDWAFDKDEIAKGSARPDSKRPILLIAPGLGGKSTNMYTVALLREARNSGFKVGTICFRGAQNLPITSGKINYSGSWEDCKAAIEYVYKKYKQGHDIRMYAYGCSLGG